MFDWLQVAMFLVVPFLVIVLLIAKVRAKDRELYDDTTIIEDLNPGDPYYKGRAIIDASAICEQRRHGRRRGGHIVVEWDRSLFPRDTTDVGVHAAWLERVGPRVGIYVVRRITDNGDGEA